MRLLRRIGVCLWLAGAGAWGAWGAAAQSPLPHSPPQFSPLAATQVTGIWKVAGQSDDGSYHFKGTVEITPVANVFRVTWKVETVKATRGGYAPFAEVTGVGQLADGNFVAGYNHGLVVARPQPNGTFAVKWYHLSEPYSGFETWSR